MKSFKLILISLFLTSGLLSDTSFTCANPKEFVPVYSNNGYSKLVQIGNTSLCADNNQDGVCEDPGTATNNNIWMINNDFDSDTVTTINSSAAYLDVPAGKTILWAGLFWQGYMVNQTDAQKAMGQRIKYKHENDEYQIELNGDMNWVYFNSSRMYYQGFTDITSYVNQNGAGYYWVGDIATTEGQPAGGSFGAWSIAVVYQDYSEDYKNTTVFHGYQAFAGSTDIANAISYADDNHCDEDNTGVGNNVSSLLSGFLTPKTNTVNSTLIVFAGEGDIGLSGDSGSLTDLSGTPHALTNAVNPSSNIMNATISRNGVIVTDGKPYYSDNSLGADIDTYDVSGILNNNQSSTSISFSTSGDGYMPGVYALETQLYVPKFCYDYSYKQQGIPFTEDNNGTSKPNLTGDVIEHEPVNMSIFVRNLVDSDVIVQDMNISVLDMNTSQVTYIRDTTRLAKTGDLNPAVIPDSTLSVSDSYIKGIDAGTINSQETFYVYYDLDPQTTYLNDPINVQANYNIVVDGMPIPYTLELGVGMPMCTSNNFVYTPEPGLFNIVHDNYYNNFSDYYNLPTQVANREGNFKVISMDPDNLDTLKGSNTIVAVELIDVGGFHDSEAACMEIDSSISQRVWVIFDNNATSVPFDQTALQSAIATGMTQLTNSSQLFSISRENAAFRISYSVMDSNGTAVYLEKESNGEYTMLNWRTAWNGDACTQDMDNNINNLDSVASYCNGTGNNPSDLATCMECVYGKDTKFTCSRDNFAIRPEAFLLHIDDQNQTSSSNQARITTDYSGVVAATAPTINLATDYDYNLEINATNHQNNDTSFGYTKSFTELITTDTAKYTWNPISTITPGACNDESNTSIEMRFLNGAVDINTSFDNVGEYQLNVLDTTWTDVDHNPLFMTHHTGAHFSAGTDCVTNSATTQPVNSSTLNGCNISSSHTNPSNSYVYNDYSIASHPYMFAVSNNITLGMGNGGAGVTPSITFKPFVYMSNIHEDENMSVHLNTIVTAKGYNGSSELNNYVTGCFAKPLSFNIDKTDTTNPILAYKYIVHNKDINGTNIVSQDINQSIAAGNLTEDPTFSTTSAYFQKDQNGTIQLLTNLNYHRDVNVTTNPEDINFTAISVEDNATLLNVDLLNNKTIEGNTTINQRVLHYYGRTNAPKITIECAVKPCITGTHSSSNTSTAEFIYYEIFCEGGTCNSSILPIGTVQTNDIRWFTNNNHDQDGVPIDTDGEIGTITEVVSSGNFNENSRSIDIANYKTESVIQYNGPLPYDMNLQMDSSKWLIYNETDANATTNEFLIEFIGSGGWSGKYEEDSTTKTISAPVTNKKIMW